MTPSFAALNNTIGYQTARQRITNRRLKGIRISKNCGSPLGPELLSLESSRVNYTTDHLIFFLFLPLIPPLGQIDTATLISPLGMYYSDEVQDLFEAMLLFQFAYADFGAVNLSGWPTERPQLSKNKSRKTKTMPV